MDSKEPLQIGFSEQCSETANIRAQSCRISNGEELATFGQILAANSRYTRPSSRNVRPQGSNKTWFMQFTCLPFGRNDRLFGKTRWYPLAMAKVHSSPSGVNAFRQLDEVNSAKGAFLLVSVCVFLKLQINLILHFHPRLAFQKFLWFYKREISIWKSE